MDTIVLENKFARIGARFKVADRPTRRFRSTAGVVSLDVGNDRKGEFFEIVSGPEAQVDVLDVQPSDRHLLLLVRESGEKQKFLCGYDERHWFVAAIPEKAPVGTVRQAKEALKPVEVQIAQARSGLNGKARNRRKNAAYIRQGEWFFLPAPDFSVEDNIIWENEPLVRGNGGKPHWAESCCRVGGQLVFVCSHYPNGLTQAQHRELLARRPKAKLWGWRTMRRNPSVYVKGHIRHPDHKTIVLHGWHRVLMNTESQAKAMRNVAFLD